MKTTLIIIAVLLILATLVGWNMFKASAQYTAAKAPVDFYSLSATTLDGDDFALNSLEARGF